MLNQLEKSISILESSPRIFGNLVSPLTVEQMSWKPSAERWSISEILVHLKDVEELNLGLRVRTICEEESPLLVDYDQEAAYREGRYSGVAGDRALAAFEETRAASLSYLRRLDDSVLDRIGRHPAVGEIRVEQLLSLWGFHDLSHIRQVAELVKALAFWEGVGSLQVYYSISP